MNRLQIITNARSLMAETDASASYVTNSELYSWLNDGIEDMCVKGEVYLKTLTLTLSNNVPTYHLPWDFISPKHILSPSNSPLDPISEKDVGRSYTVLGRPLYYYLTTSTPLTLSAWQSGTSYVVWPNDGTYTSTYIRPTTPNGFMYECVKSGTSGGSEPTWPTILGQSVNDGSTTWTCRNLLSSLKRITFVSTPLTANGGTGDYTILYSARDGGLHSDTSSPSFDEDKHRYLIPYICYRWSIKSRNSQLAMAFYQEYAAGVGLPTQPPPDEGT